MLIKIYANDRLLKPGEHIVIQKRTSTEEEIEELFRWTYPINPFGNQVTARTVEIKGGEEPFI